MTNTQAKKKKTPRSNSDLAQTENCRSSRLRHTARRGEPVLAGSVVQTRPLFTTSELWNICYLAKVSARSHPLPAEERGGSLLSPQTQSCLINTQICSRFFPFEGSNPLFHWAKMCDIPVSPLEAVVSHVCLWHPEDMKMKKNTKK